MNSGHPVVSKRNHLEDAVRLVELVYSTLRPSSFDMLESPSARFWWLKFCFKISGLSFPNGRTIGSTLGNEKTSPLKRGKKPKHGKFTISSRAEGSSELHENTKIGASEAGVTFLSFQFHSILALNFHSLKMEPYNAPHHPQRGQPSAFMNYPTKTSATHAAPLPNSRQAPPPPHPNPSHSHHPGYDRQGHGRPHSQPQPPPAMHHSQISGAPQQPGFYPGATNGPYPQGPPPAEHQTGSSNSRPPSFSRPSHYNYVNLQLPLI
ncbi:hypothetical protein DL96DRAFT_786575 [Flagelloscypha sp. PMI_526]|nr:hypothetical protein DL96DRAFT_786575 [Flagelloscypha sp. PMI_526]